MYVNIRRLKQEYINEIEVKYQLIKREGIKQKVFRNHDVKANCQIKLEEATIVCRYRVSLNVLLFNN